MSQIEIHLVIHFGQDDLHVDFPFDTQNDNIDDVVSELVSQLSQQSGEPLPPEAIPQIKQNIENQIPKSSTVTPSSPVEPIQNQTVSNRTETESSDDDINDPEYETLLLQQKQEMQKLLADHLEERKKLAAQIKDSMKATLMLPNEVITAPTKSEQPQSPPPTICDDLIVF